jgi:glycerophosphoryl diester phosphodiesterase
MSPAARRLPHLALLLALAPLLGCITDEVQVIAHRGASFDAPEHTFAAYDLALAQEADWIEQDLQMTADGALVVMHDDSLDRTARGPAADCSGLVREKSLAQLARCEVGSWFNGEYAARAVPDYARERIPTLDSVLTRYAGRARFYIETKNPAEAPGMEEALLGLLRKHRLIGRGAARGAVLLQSFSAASLERLHDLDPSVPLVQLIDEPVPPDSLDAVFTRIARYAGGIGPSRRIISAAFVERAHAAGLVVHPYTVNEPATMSYLLDLGVDGMFTDRPAVLRGLLSP